MIWTIARYSLREALSNRVLIVAGVLLLATFLVAEFVGAVALVEHRAVQAALAGALLRWGAVLVIALLVVTALLREQQDRVLALLLALPYPRAHYVLGKLLAYLALSAILALACGLLALAYAPGGAALRWSLSLACELWLVAALGQWLAFTFRQPVVALASLFAIYGLSRATAALVLIADAPVLGPRTLADQLLAGFVEGLAWVLPALHRFTDAAWLAHGHGDWSVLAAVLLQAGVYIALLAAAAMFDLYRREV